MFRKRAESFTLVELMVVISIISVLSGILAPFVGKAVDKARKLKASRNLQQIAMAYATFSMSHSTKELNMCKSANEWAGVMSKHGILNSASLFILNDDYLVEQHPNRIPKTIGLVKNGIWQIDESFKNYPLSVSIIVGLNPHSPPESTPIAFSRGLDFKTGRWRPSLGPDGGVYGETGGFVAFLDGHVEFLENINSADQTSTELFSALNASHDLDPSEFGPRVLSWNASERSAR